jgi:hypothetical protein
MKKVFINWCRSCHFDWLICVKEVKGKRWMCILSHIENNGNFSVDDFNDVNDSWKIILKTINKMSVEEISYLQKLKYNI